MDTLERIRTKLSSHPELSWRLEERRVVVDPVSPSGFTVWFEVQDSGYRVGFDGWHEEFEDEVEALECFAFGFREDCRLRVVLRGRCECSWTVEFKDGDVWRVDSTTGLVFIPFWRKKTVEYRHNPIIRGHR